MKITKYIHSCVLVEEGDDALLFDPGTFSFMDEWITPELFSKVKLIVITHNHPDHYDTEAIKKIVELSGATILTTPEVATVLSDAGIPITGISTDLDYTVGFLSLRAIPAEHEPILADNLPQNYGYIVNDRLLHPGDSFAASLADAGAEVVLLPVTAPWTTQLGVVDFARDTQAKILIPIHDGYVKEFFQQFQYSRFETSFAKDGMKFIPLSQPGDSVEV